jgi:uncharacterized repeat protein (TIGR01451 family)
MVALVVISSLVVPPAFSQETEDSQVFIAGFNAYQQKDYAAAIEKMDEVLKKYPDTPLRDMALFWLARAYFKTGNQQDAARYLSQFSKEYPDNPLKGTVEEDLLSLVTRYEKGEKLSPGTPPPKQPDRQAAQKLRAEKERIAVAKAEEAARTAAAAEATRLAALKQVEEKAAAEKRERDRVAALKAEQERIALERAAREKAEQQRIAALKVEEGRKVAEKAEQDRIAAVKASEAKQAAASVEEAARIAAAAEATRLAAFKTDQERLEKEKQAEQRRAAERVEQQRIALLKTEEERNAAARAEQQRLVREKAEQEKAAAVKAEQAKIAATQEAEARKIAAAKAEQERIAAVKAEESKLAAAAAESARIAALKAEKDRQEQEQAELQRLVAVKAEQEKLAAVNAENERRAASEKAEQERQTVAKAEDARKAALAAESARLASLKAEEERRIAEKAALSAEAARQASIRAEEQKAAQQRLADDKIKVEKAALRDKAIAQYKSIIDKYPSSNAAASAAAKLRELGVAVALPPKVAAAETVPENAQILRLEVAQFAGFEFNLQARPAAYNVARRVSIPFEIINRGNGNDSFNLESAFPAAFNASFASASSPEISINQTPAMNPGETFKGVVNLVIPATSIDGLRISHPVKAASRFMAEASQSREVGLTASAPLLRAVLKTDKTQPLPGEKVVYRIAVLNVGSTVAEDVTFRINFPPQLEPLDFVAAGFKQEMKSALVFDGLKVNSGESREFSVTFQLKEDSLAGQELSTRAELINNPLKTTAAFVSNMAYVQPQRGILVRSGSGRTVAIPGQTITVPFVVTNTGNVREKFKITSVLKGAQDAVIFHDINRDGIRQASEPVISEIGPLAPKEEASVVMEIKTPRTAADGSEGSVQLSFSSEGNPGRTTSGSTQLVYSRPVLQMTMAGRDGRMKPGEVASFDLTITNKGSNLARVVELQSAWPEQLELVAADPANSETKNGNIIWRFKEMGASEKRIIKVSFRVKPGTGVGTNIQVKNVMTYEDQLGNRY